MVNADLSNSNLAAADFNHADLQSVNFTGSNLAHCNLADSNLRGAKFCNSSLNYADLWLALFNNSDLSGADFSKASVGLTTFNEVDLSKVKGLNTMTHLAPSSIGVDTIYLSKGQISKTFLKGAGVPNALIEYVNSIVSAETPSLHNSCFISYSSKDERFAKYLYSRLQDAGLQVWIASEDLKGGENLREQIDRAIQVHSKLLVVLSKNSLRSKWVETEIREALTAKRTKKRKKLFPISLISFKQLLKWECFDSDTGEDLARKVRELVVPDFSNWEDQRSFETAFVKLVDDLRAKQ